MINDSLKFLYWKTNSNTFLGYQPGTLLVCNYRSGGGFAGAPQEITVCPIQNIAKGQPDPKPTVFLLPGPGLEYHIGGLAFMNYAYMNPHLLADSDDERL